MKKTFLASLMVFLMTAAVFAEDAQRPITGGKVGLSFFTAERITDLFMSEGNLKANYVEYSGISLIWHVTDSIALEPSVLFNYRDYTYTNSSGTSTTDNTTVWGAALGIYYYSNLSGNAYMYIGPRGDYLSMQDTDNDSTGSYEEDNTNSFGISLVLGLKYMFNVHIGIFGDVSAGYFVSEQNNYDYSSTGVQTSHTKYESNNFVLAKGLVGVTLYF